VSVGRDGGRGMPSDRRVFRAPSAIVALIASAVVAVLLLGDAALRAGVAEALLLAPWVLLALWGVYVAVYVSHIRIDAEGVRVHNMLRITDVGWGCVDEIELRWQVIFDLVGGGVVKSYGGPVAGRPARPGMRPGAAERRQAPAVRDLDLIREQWYQARDAGAAPTGVRRSWDIPALIALAAIAVWAVSAVIIAGGPS
jgi:hypothetical protein